MNDISNELNPHHPLRILSLDGGGVRGLSSLIIVLHLMHNIAKEEKKLGIRAKDNINLPRPCDYFDLIGGTSTGGIVAILLGRLRLDVRDCIQIYSALAGKIFKKDRAFKVAGLKVPMGPNRFSGSVLERAIKQALVEHGFNEDEPMWDDLLFEELEQTDAMHNIWTTAQVSLQKNLITKPRIRTSMWSNRRSFSGRVPVRQASMPVMSRGVDIDVFKIMSDSRSSDDSGISFPASGHDQSRLMSSEASSETRQQRPTWKVRSQSSVVRKKDSRGCRALVVTSLKNALGVPALLSTYNPNAREIMIWEALRATSAAPTFFEEMTFGMPKMTYLDGGMGFNNPCNEIVQEANDIWPGRAVGIVVSIGTGLQTIPSVRKGASWLPFGLGVDVALVSALASMSTSTARVHNEMQRLYSGKNTKYYRFDVDSGMANISLEQWMKEDEMSSLTEQYMHDPRQLRRASHVGELIVKFSALPPKFEILPTQFTVGMSGHDLETAGYKLVDIDFKTGYELGLSVTPEQVNLVDHKTRAPGRPGVAVDVRGTSRKVLPVAQDLDHDGHKEEATVVSCVRAEDVCIRVQREGIPQGKYTVHWIVAFTDVQEDVAPPIDLVFSVGKPWDRSTFLHRFVDVKISSDVVPILLRPGAVRVRVGEKFYTEKKGRSWVEMAGDAEVEVDLDGVLGFVVSKNFEEGQYFGGWHFGGVRMVPAFSAVEEDERKRYDSL